MTQPQPTISIGDKTFTRVRVTARLQLADVERAPATVQKAVASVERQFFWQDGINPDLCHVKFILDAEGANGNWDYMPRPQLIASHATARFKPVDMDHVVAEQASMVYMTKSRPPVINTIFGVMTATALARADGTLLTPDEVNSLEQTDVMDRKPEDKITVVAWASLWNFLFPQTVATLIQEIEAGNMAVSMERWLQNFDYMRWNGKAYESVDRALAADSGIEEDWSKRRRFNGQPILRRAINYVYGGAASTNNPAQPMSQFLPPSAVKAAASQGNSDILQILLDRHGEIHRQFVVSTSGDESQRLIDEHRRITQCIATLTQGKGP